jgi:hypothetical protein
MSGEIVVLYELLVEVIVKCEAAEYSDAEEKRLQYERQYKNVEDKMSIGLRRLYEDCANTASRIIGDILANRNVENPFEASEKFRCIPDPRL